MTLIWAVPPVPHETSVYRVALVEHDKLSKKFAGDTDFSRAIIDENIARDVALELNTSFPFFDREHFCLLSTFVAITSVEQNLITVYRISHEKSRGAKNAFSQLAERVFCI